MLESWRTEQGAAAEAVVSLGDTELGAQHAEPTARLDAAEVQLLALPYDVVEPSHIGLGVDEPALLAAVSSFGRVVSPRAITAADLTLDGVPLYVQAGSVLVLRLKLRGAHHAAQSADELAFSLVAAAGATCVEASFQAPDEAQKLLHVDVSADIAGRALSISVIMPRSVPPKSVSISSISVHGQPVVGAALSIPLCRGVQASFRLELMKDARPESVCISPAGHIYIPQKGPDVLMFDSDGTPLPGVPVSGLGFSKTRWAVFSSNDEPSLILAESSGATTRLAAIDPTTQAVRWTTSPGSLQHCVGLTALPSVVFAASFSDTTLVAHRLSDGKRLMRRVVRGQHIYFAADPSTGTIFGTALDGVQYAVNRFSWTDGSELKAEGTVVAAGNKFFPRPLAVVPPASGKRVFHLIVCEKSNPELLVLALPGLILVHSHKLKGMRITAIAADPWGAAIAVADDVTCAVHILAWPLPGMPALE